MSGDYQKLPDAGISYIGRSDIKTYYDNLRSDITLGRKNMGKSNVGMMYARRLGVVTVDVTDTFPALTPLDPRLGTENAAPVQTSSQGKLVNFMLESSLVPTFDDDMHVERGIEDSTQL